MNGDQRRDRIVCDADLHGGEPCIKGTRIMVSVVLDYLKAGETPEDIRRQYATLTDEDVRAALAYGAWLAHGCKTGFVRLRNGICESLADVQRDVSRSPLEG